VENVDNSKKYIYSNDSSVFCLWKTLWKNWLVFHRV